MARGFLFSSFTYWCSVPLSTHSQSPPKHFSIIPIHTPLNPTDGVFQQTRRAYYDCYPIELQTNCKSSSNGTNPQLNKMLSYNGTQEGNASPIPFPTIGADENTHKHTHESEDFYTYQNGLIPCKIAFLNRAFRETPEVGDEFRKWEAATQIEINWDQNTLIRMKGVACCRSQCPFRYSPTSAHFHC